MDSSKLTSRIEIAANLAIIFVAIAIGGVLVKNYYFTPSTTPKAPVKGKQISISDIDWQAKEQTLLIVLKEGCSFCSQSAPFYQKIAQEAGDQKNQELIIVSPQEVDKTLNYVKSLSVPINNVKQVSLDSLGVSGTPALILVDKEGRVISSWIGKLPPEKETEVLNQLKCKECNS
jgi:thioredoxin-related protein